jgi:hypothetical protein
MPSQTSTLDGLITQLQQQFGPQAAQRAACLPCQQPATGIPFGLSALDKILPEGLPRGQVSELSGAPAVGARTLAFHAIAQTHVQGTLACYLDVGQTFAGAAAIACGVDLGRLVVARPQGAREAAQLLGMLLARQATGLLVIDSLPQLLALPTGIATVQALGRHLPRRLKEAGCALLVLNSAPLHLAPGGERSFPAAWASYTALRLGLAHAGWIGAGSRIGGRLLRVAVRRPPFDHDAHVCTLALRYPLLGGRL